MRLTGEAEFLSCTTGTKKDGTPWHRAKFFDTEADEIFSAFVNEDLCKELLTYQKKMSVLLTLNLVPGQSYFNLENIEMVL